MSSRPCLLKLARSSLTGVVMCDLELLVTCMRKEAVTAHGAHSPEASGRLQRLHAISSRPLPRCMARPSLHSTLMA